MTTSTVIEQRQLRGSLEDDALQRVAIVYIGRDEYRLYAPAKATGDALQWMGHFYVRQRDTESLVPGEIEVQGTHRVHIINLVKQELEKTSANTNSSTREENRRAKLRELLDDISNLRSCGPSDDPDEQTSVIESYRYLLINVKALSKGVLPTDVCEELAAIPSDIETVYDVYESKAHLDAVCVDIRSELEKKPTTITAGSAPAPDPKGDDLDKWHLVRMAAEAPTLRDLKALSISKQAQLLLRRLATQYPRSDMSVGKMNLDMYVHAKDLASGYSDSEVTAVKDLLLAAPWKRLESDGFIRDNGHNFFHVTAEGYEAAKKCEAFFVNRDVIEALKLLHPEFQDYAHYFHEDKLPEAIAAAFERYENRLNEIRDRSKNAQVMATAGHALVYKLFEMEVLKEPYPALGSNSTTKAAYEKGLTGVMSGGVTWLRNARTHEKHNLPAPTATEALELLFVASYLMRMLDLALR
jgi:Protein of unknown function (Hypoth_ymh)